MMGDTAFTPGPWMVDGTGDVCARERTVAISSIGGKPVLEEDANANLIAAAPDLYEALEAVFEFSNRTANGLAWRFSDQPCAKQARAALAKARGEVA